MMFVDLKNWLRDFIERTSEDMFPVLNTSHTNLGVQKNFFLTHNRGFHRQQTIDNVDISDICANSVFQSGRDYKLCMGHVAFLLLN